MQGTPWQRTARAIRWVARLPEIRALFRFLQILSSLLFVVLYVWGTYSTPKPFFLALQFGHSTLRTLCHRICLAPPGMPAFNSVIVAVLLCIPMQANCLCKSS